MGRVKREGTGDGVSEKYTPSPLNKRLALLPPPMLPTRIFLRPCLRNYTSKLDFASDDLICLFFMIM